MTKPLKTFTVDYKVTGRAHATIQASSLEEATQIARAYEVDATLTEWEFESVKHVEEQR